MSFNISKSVGDTLRTLPDLLDKVGQQDQAPDETAVKKAAAQQVIVILINPTDEPDAQKEVDLQNQDDQTAGKGKDNSSGVG